MLSVRKKEVRGGASPLGRHFRRVRSHATVSREELLRVEDTAFVYPLLSSEAEMEYSRVVTLEFPLTSCTCVYGWDFGISFLHRDGSDAVAIRGRAGNDFGGRIVAVYVPSRRVLITSDWGCMASETVSAVLASLGLEPHQPEPVNNVNFLIGSDPEFELWTGNYGIVSADSETDDLDLGDLGNGAEMGLDGSQDQLELRLPPATDGESLYQGILQAVRSWESYTGHCVCLSGHTYPLGCHVHVGTDDDAYAAGAGQEEIEEFVRSLDRAYGDLVLPLSGRARGYYQVLGAWEWKTYGLEYRTPPSAILALPEVAIPIFDATLAIARGEDYVFPVSFWSGIEKIRGAVGSQTPFTFDLGPLAHASPSSHATWRSGDHWSSVVRNVISHLDAPIHFFGLAEWRGLVTNDPSLAAAMGWGVVEMGVEGVGLPYAFRSSPSAADLERFAAWARAYAE